MHPFCFYCIFVLAFYIQSAWEGLRINHPFGLVIEIFSHAGVGFGFKP